MRWVVRDERVSNVFEETIEPLAQRFDDARRRFSDGRGEGDFGKRGAFSERRGNFYREEGANGPGFSCSWAAGQQHELLFEGGFYRLSLALEGRLRQGGQ